MAYGQMDGQLEPQGKFLRPLNALCIMHLPQFVPVFRCLEGLEMLFLSNDHPLGYDTPDCGCVSYTYAHGKLERMLGSDLLGSTNWFSPLPGVRKAVVEREDGDAFPVLCFVWKWKHGIKGLVVLPTDQEAVADAIRCYEEKPWHI